MTPDRRPNQPSPRWQRILLLAFREPGRHFFCELHLHPQLIDRGLVILGLGPQADQLGPLGLSQRGIRGYPRCRGLSCHLHPLAQSHLMDADVAGDLSNRTAAVKDESYRLLLVLRRKCAACRTHISLSRKIRAAKPGVHRSGNGSDLPSRPGRCHPRIHDLRHSLAVTTLLAWYADGGDVQARLPQLSTFLGHADPASTYWYLLASPELMAGTGARLDGYLAGRS